MKRRTVLALLSAIAIDLRAATLAESGSALARQLAAAVERGDTPGVVALLVDRDGVLYEGCAGKLDVAGNLPMRSDAIFRIASMTKPITSVACMLLVQEGKLSLDLSWAGLFNTQFWIDRQRHVAAVMMMQLLPFYDDGAIRTLRDFERTVYQHQNS